MIIQVVTGTAPTPHEVQPDIPIEVSRVVERAMARKREDRYASAIEFQAALLDVAGQTGEQRISRMMSDMPPFELTTEGSGTRRLTPDERVTLADEDVLADSQADAVTNAPPRDSKRPTEALTAPPVTQTLKTLIHNRPTRGWRSRRFALIAMAAAAVLYTAFVLIQVRQRAPSPAETAPTADIAASAPSAAAQPSAAAAAQPPTAPDTARPARTAGERVEPMKSADNTPSAKPKSRASKPQLKVRKAQGALRNLDF